MKSIKRGDYQVTKGQKFTDKKITETAGYIPKNIQIENMMISGYNLAMARKEMYDFPSLKEVDEKFNDPTRKWSYDPAEASRDGREVNGRLAEQRRMAEIKSQEIQDKKLEQLVDQKVKERSEKKAE